MRFQFAENLILNPCFMFLHFKFLGNHKINPEMVRNKKMIVAIPTIGRPIDESTSIHRCNLNMDKKKSFSAVGSGFSVSPVYGFTKKTVPLRFSGEVFTRNSYGFSESFPILNVITSPCTDSVFAIDSMLSISP